MSEITRSKDTIGGQYRIKGTRISVGIIKSFARAGYSSEAIQLEYPSLSIQQIEAAIRFRLKAPTQETEG